LKIVVFGATGQVGFEVCRADWPPGTAIRPLDRATVDIADRGTVVTALAAERPDLAINLAAYTAVDQAEREPARAFAVNSAGAANVAAACAIIGVPLIHLSTDYVFDGTKRAPYREDDPVNPLGVYGRSKEEGEGAVREALSRHIILRTSWVYGVRGANFVKTMLRLAAERPTLSVVADQTGCPTAARDIAAALVALAGALQREEEAWGTYHFADAGPITWHGFAEAIIERAAPFLARRPRVQPISTADYPTPARRPANSVLDCGKIEHVFGITPPSWRDGLQAVIGEILGGSR
jgi:dTDP-4-dehydrorhamnose reductase